MHQPSFQRVPVAPGFIETLRQAFGERVQTGEAVCLQHGVTELWTADRDYLAYPALRVRNPLIDIPPTRASEPRGTYKIKASGSSRRRARSPR